MRKQKIQPSFTINKKRESGRSMVEMLGVLAIIGILSITGVYGYTVAMRRYRASEIAQTISIMAILAAAADHGSGDCIQLSTSNLPKPTGLNIDDIVVDVNISGTTRYAIKLDSDDQALCATIGDIVPFENIICGSADISELSCPE